MNESVNPPRIAPRTLAGLLILLAVNAACAFGADAPADYQIKPLSNQQAGQYKLDPAFFMTMSTA